jgi:hypothetical protein
VSEKIPYFLAYLKNSSFHEENECLEKKGAGCGHQSSGDSCSGGNVGAGSVLARVKNGFAADRIGVA